MPKKKRKTLGNYLYHAISRGCLLGEQEWVEATAELLMLQSTLRPVGRPKKEV